MVPVGELNSFNQKTFDNIANALSQTGYMVLKNTINKNLLQSLQLRIKQIPTQLWQQAGVGRKQGHQINTDIRSDKISWITQEDPIEKEFLDYMEYIRHGINQRLFLGLFDYESHFSIYSKGSYYQKHVDSLKGNSNRVLSTVVYLNDNWQENHGGELLIYNDTQIIQSVLPHFGTMVIFLSEGIPHEVLKANRERHSIAGWFRANANHSNIVDPSQ